MSISRLFNWLEFQSVVGGFSWTLCCPFRWSWRSFVTVVIQPILFWVIQWINHFWHQFVLLCNLEHRTCILVPSTVVCRWENSKKLSPCEPLETIHHTFVRSQNIPDLIVLQKEFDTVRTKFNDIPSSVRVSNEVWLNTELLIAISGVRPQNIDYKLLF